MELIFPTERQTINIIKKSYGIFAVWSTMNRRKCRKEQENVQLIFPTPGSPSDSHPWIPEEVAT